MGIMVKKREDLGIVGEMGWIVVEIRKGDKEERERENKLRDGFGISFLREEERNGKG